MLQLLYIVVSVSTMAFAIDMSPNVVGGATNSKDAPWIVSLQLDENDFAYCGATLINSTQRGGPDNCLCSGWVVTAASCLSLSGINKTIIATLGNLDLENPDQDETRCEIVKPYLHPNYTETTRVNDIGLIHVYFNSTLDECEEKHTCDMIPHLRYWNELGINETVYPLINATIYGWGLKAEDGLLQKNLQNTTISLKTDKECADDYGVDDFQSASMICAGGQGRGPCSYDTGGPLTCQYKQESEEDEHVFLCGIASFGNGCGPNSFPSVFTDISTKDFVTWINDTIANSTISM